MGGVHPTGGLHSPFLKFWGYWLLCAGMMVVVTYVDGPRCGRGLHIPVGVVCK